MYTPANYCVCVLKFRMCEHGMPCALEINSNDGSKRGILPFNHNKHISNTTMPMATKLGRVVTYPEEHPPITSREHLITWSCEAM